MTRRRWRVTLDVALGLVLSAVVASDAWRNPVRWELAGGLAVVAEAADGRAAVDHVLATGPDVVLLDIRMPVLDGLAAAAEIRRLVPGTGVIMLTTFGEDDYIERALSLGAGGFLLKSGDPRELLSGIHAVADGAAFLSPKVAQRVIARAVRRTADPRPRRASRSPS